MRISTIAVGGTAAAALIASGAGFAAASTSTVQRSAASGTEHFSLMSTQPSASKYVAIASGLFTASGVDISGNSVDLVRLSGGTFKINHGTAVHILKEKLNQQTCLLQFAATAKFKVEDGTRAYKGISGSGKALITGLGIARRSHGQCNPNANPLASEQTITATAHIHL
jgi:hypothetical protein